MSPTPDEAGGVPKIATGIKGFDTLLHGGVPAGRTLLVTGGSGTGKTVLLNEFLYRGITEFDHNGVLVTFEETPADVRKNVRGLGWDYAGLERAGRLAIIYVTPEVEPITLQIREDFSIGRFIEPILHVVRTHRAERLAIDNLGALFTFFRSEAAVRHLFHLLLARLKEAGVTTMISSETTDGRSTLSDYGIEQFIADGVVTLDMEVGPLRTVVSQGVV